VATKKGKNKGGRPSKYKPTMCDRLLKYFDVDPYTEETRTIKYKNGTEIEEPMRWPTELPLISGFARSVGVCHETILEWARVHPKFSLTLKVAKTMQKHILITNGLLGLYDKSFGIFTAKNIIGWRDTRDINIHPSEYALQLMEMISKNQPDLATALGEAIQELEDATTH